MKLTGFGTKRSVSSAVRESALSLAGIDVDPLTPNVDTGIHRMASQTAKKGNIIGHIAIYENMHFEMDVQIKSFPDHDGWVSIFHCGQDDYQRFPGVWIHKNAKIGFYIRFSDQDDWDRGTGTFDDLVANQWYHLEIDVTKTTFRVTVDGVVKYDERKSRHNVYDDMVCYLGDPWYDAADVEVKNLKYDGTDSDNEL